MSTKNLFFFTLLSLVSSFDIVLSHRCREPYTFKGTHPTVFKINMCPDGEPWEANSIIDGFNCVQGSCNIFNFNCNTACRRVYPLNENDIIGFIDTEFSTSKIIIAGTILNSTHLRFSGLINSKKRIQTFVAVPGAIGGGYNITYMRMKREMNWLDREAPMLKQIEKLLPKSAAVIDHLDIELKGAWQSYFDSDDVMKLNAKNLETLGKNGHRYYQITRFNATENHFDDE